MSSTSSVVDRLLRLWFEPIPADDQAAVDSFRALYCDPLTINGASMTVRELVGRAKSVQGSLADPQRKVVDVVDAGDKIAVAFRLSGRHVGPIATAAGEVAPTGQHISMQVIDILTLTQGRISEIVMVADELGAFAASGALTLG